MLVAMYSCTEKITWLDLRIHTTVGYNLMPAARYQLNSLSGQYDAKQGSSSVICKNIASSFLRFRESVIRILS